ncbi:MAG: hypothetical protein D6689_19430 [Deltaproteobacteria bacterium]|nr:MAG: hypothetical protein D6689_19430 [Deltaproteobacteria bacterium]
MQHRAFAAALAASIATVTAATGAAAAAPATYAYDDAGRLVLEVNGNIRIAYRYDDAGNFVGQTACVADCYIDDTCYTAGDANPTNACEICDPSASADAFTPLPDGAACDDGDACTAGETCGPDGCTGGEPVACADPGPCQAPGTCNPDSGECEYAPAPDGTPCEGGVCAGGACDTGGGGGDGGGGGGCGCRATGSRGGTAPWWAALAIAALIAIRLRRRGAGWAALAALVLAAGSRTARAETVCTDGSCDYTTIGEALLDTPTGATIVVKPGVYRESNLTLRHRVLTAENPEDPSAVTIDAEGNGFVFRTVANAVIRGVTIRGGSAPLDAGGGARIEGPGATTFQRVVFEGNHSGRTGGALHVVGGAVFIDDCVFRDNTADRGGGAMSDSASSRLVITRSRFENNRVVFPTSFAFGGAVAAGATIEIFDTEFIGNSVATGGFDNGGALHLPGAATIVRSTFTGNSVGGAGGGGGGAIYAGNVTSLPRGIALVDVTMAGNSATRGGGLYISVSPGLSVHVEGGSITGNMAEAVGDGGGIYCAHPAGLVSMTAALSGNTVDDHAGCDAPCTAGETRACDTGEPGVCAPGTQTCQASGFWGTCEPDVADQPPEADCADDADGDCDGLDDASDPDCRPIGLTTQGQVGETGGRRGDPVSTFTGELFRDEAPDLVLHGPGAPAFARYYASGLDALGRSGRLGRNWRHRYEWTLTESAGAVTVIDPRGRAIAFARAGGVWQLDETTDIPFALADGIGADYELYDPRDGRLYAFSAGALIAIVDRNGNRTDLSYNGADLALVTGPYGDQLALTYDGAGLLAAVSDGVRTVAFGHSGADLVTVTDAAGATTTYAYAAGGLLTSVTAPDGDVVVAQTFDGSGRVASQAIGPDGSGTISYDSATQRTMTDPAGRTSRHIYDERGRLLRIEWEDGSIWDLDYDADGRRAGVTYPTGRGHVVSRAPGSPAIVAWTSPVGATATAATGLLPIGRALETAVTAIAWPDGTTETYEYDAAGNVVARVDRGGGTTTWTYDDRGLRTSTTTPLGGTWTFTYDASGNLTAIADPDGRTVSYGYDALDRPTTTTYPNGATESRTYDARDRVVSFTDSRGGVTAYGYDAAGDLVSITDPEGNTSTMTWDAAGRLASHTDARGHTESVTYDSAGRAVAQTDRAGATSATEYDAAGRITAVVDANGNRWTFAYTPDGQLESVGDPLGNATVYAYDARGLLASITDELGGVTMRTYDDIGRLTRSVDPRGGATTIAYDNTDRIASITAPGGVTASYEYDLAGNLTAITDPAGERWTFSYDATGLLVSRTDPLGNATAIEYDDMAWPSRYTLPGGLGTVAISYDAAGNIVAQDYSDGTSLAYVYDGRDLLVGGNGVTLSRDENGDIVACNGVIMTRDPEGRIATMEVAAGKTVTYTYDAAGNLVAIDDWLGNRTEMDYDAAGQRIAIRRPNGVDTAIGYDARRHVVSVDTTRGADVVGAIALTRDALGDVVAAQRDVPAAPVAPPAGVSLTIGGASQVAEMTYDALGRVTDDGVLSYTWVGPDLLASYSDGTDTVSFEYDGLMRVVARTDAGGAREEYVWNYGTLEPSIAVIRRDGADWRYYVRADDGALLYSVDAATDDVRFYHFDEVGNVLFVTDAAGSVVQRYAYSAFGELLGEDGGLDNPFTYAGRYSALREGDTGLYRMGRRVYDSRSKRFLSREPVAARDYPTDVTPYVYARSNPLRYADWMGEAPADMRRRSPAPAGLKAGLKTFKATKFAVERVAGKRIKQARRVVDRAERLARSARVWNQPVPAAVQRTLDSRSLRALRRVGQTLDDLGSVAKVAGYGVALKEKGFARATGELVVTDLAKKRFGTRGASVVGVGVAAYDTYQAVNKVQARLRKLQQANIDSMYARQDLLLEMWRAKLITEAEFLRMRAEVMESFDLERRGTMWAGLADIGVESLKGLQNMLMKWIGL